MTNAMKEQAAAWDQADVLSRFREEFYLPAGEIYLDGNSLGLLSKRAEKSVWEALSAWRERGIDGWIEGERPWFPFAERLGAMMAPLVGADAEEVMVTGSTTVNLHQMLATFYRPQGARTHILADVLNFPSDIYAIQSQLRLHGLDPAEHLLQVKSEDGHTLDEDAIIAAMSDEVAVVVLSAVLYRSGQLLDMERITQAARERGILIGWDLCHSIGAVPHRLSEWGVDFAFWCNYKYLNSGPGSVGGLFVHKRHHGRLPGLAGWFGSNKEVQFDMDHHFTPASDAGAYQIGTPHLLSAAPVYGSLELFREAGMEQIRRKSLSLTRFLMELVETELAGMGFSIVNPRADNRRGGHVALVHEEAVRIAHALKEAGVIPDFRAPNILRLAPVALYNSYTDVWEAVQRLKRIMVEKEYERFEKKRGVVA
ncbi:kynureninase [Desmospora activa]|uniref:Kynureninase n=1 Tax=Desmospora activa DSM 45169 TaxID=1121389 RepID=A0A2T4ZAT2_9BACL|nr:kynureninase [Desmospora activa]PTM58992.1 kynureninase [Desmospora activa DSM 45169]